HALPISTQAAVEQGTVDQEILDDMQWAGYPRVDEDTESAPPLGGINLGVGAASEHPELAYEAIQCIVDPDRQTQYFLSDGNPPASTVAYDDPEVEETYPMAPDIQEHWTPIGAVGETTPAESQEFIQDVLRGDALQRAMPSPARIPHRRLPPNRGGREDAGRQTGLRSASAPARSAAWGSCWPHRPSWS